MTRDELKAKLSLIVTDITLTKERRDEKLLPIMKDLLDSEEDSASAADIWNNVMAELVEENGLARH